MNDKITVPKARLDELNQRIDAMATIAKECVEACERILKVAKGG